MIQLIKQPENSLQNLENRFRSISSFPDLVRIYDSIIKNYKELDLQYKFTESIDEEYILHQLKQQFSKKNAPLFGIPLGVKDIFNTKVLPTSMGSEIWKGFKTGNNARIVDEFIDKGGVVFSKTTTAEFAVHFITPEKTINPYEKNHITGTSSTGSAVAVSCGALPVALGTQTAGSIIRPASFCGVYGFKPSFGALDRTGVLKTNDTLDTIGFLASDIYGINRLFYNVIQKGSDYPFSLNYFKYFKAYKEKKKNTIRIGVLGETFTGFTNYDSEVLSDFQKLVNIFQDHFNVKPVSGTDFINTIHPLHESIYSKSLSYYFQNEIKHYNSVSEIMRNMIAKGEKIKTENYIKAIQQQPLLRKQFDEVFKDFDFIITPSTASVAPKLHNYEKDDTCLIWTFLGYPALSIPLFLGDNSKLPFGLQIVAKKFDDFSLLNFAQYLEDNIL